MPLINFLRAKMIESPMALPATPPEMNEKRVDFHRIVTHYGLAQYVHPQQFYRWRGAANSAVMSAAGPQPSVHATKWATFVMRPKDHKRIVTSYEVILGASVERIQIGWAVPYYTYFATGEGEMKGVGEEQASIALDGSRYGVQFNGGTLKEISGMLLEPGTVITCEHKPGECVYRWLVNGVEVAVIPHDSITGVNGHQYLQQYHKAKEGKISKQLS